MEETNTGAARAKMSRDGIAFRKLANQLSRDKRQRALNS